MVTETMESVQDQSAAQPIPIPDDIDKRLKRGRERLKQVTAPRKLCVEFTNGRQYGYLTEDELKVKQQSTVAISMGGLKPDHRVRLSHNQILPIVKAKVASACSQIPTYECTPSTDDPEDISAAKLAEKVVIAGYDLWRIKRASKALVWNALVTDEAFAMAYWDPTVGPYVEHEITDEETGEPLLDPKTGEPMRQSVGMGEIKVKVWSGLEVGWEPGVDFEDSRWWFIEHARPIEDVEREPGFVGGKLSPDAQTSPQPGKSPRGAKMVLVTEYLERPCAQYPSGRRFFSANGRVIFPEEPYPLRDAKGDVIDEPCIHQLSYDIDPSSDRDRGLVRNLIDVQREFNNGKNKIAEWMQHGLTPQLLVEEGSLTTPVTDEPGAIIEYKPPMPGQKPPAFRETKGPPQELFQIASEAAEEMSSASHSFEIPAGIRSASALSAIYEKDQLAWQDFTTDLADVFSRLGRDCLTLAQLHYTEERLIQFRGRTGWENIANFKGADLRNQTDVRVPPGSLEPRTRASIEQRIMNIAQMFPGYFPPEVLLSALEGGTAEGLIEGYEEDVARANLIISQIRSGEFWNQPMRPVFPGEGGIAENPETEEPEPLTEVPGWMPRPFDNVAVHKAIFENFFKSDEWNYLDAETKEASMAYYQALLDIEARNAQRSAQLQTEQAQQLGAANAAKPGEPKLMPSLPALNSGSESSPAGPAQ